MARKKNRAPGASNGPKGMEHVNAKARRAAKRAYRRKAAALRQNGPADPGPISTENGHGRGDGSSQNQSVTADLVRGMEDGVNHIVISSDEGQGGNTRSGSAAIRPQQAGFDAGVRHQDQRRTRGGTTYILSPSHHRKPSNTSAQEPPNQQTRIIAWRRAMKADKKLRMAMTGPDKDPQVITIQKMDALERWRECLAILKRAGTAQSVVENLKSKLLAPILDPTAGETLSMSSTEGLSLSRAEDAPFEDASGASTTRAAELPVRGTTTASLPAESQATDVQRSGRNEPSANSNETAPAESPVGSQQSSLSGSDPHMTAKILPNGMRLRPKAMRPEPSVKEGPNTSSVEGLHVEVLLDKEEMDGVLRSQPEVLNFNLQTVTGITSKLQSLLEKSAFAFTAKHDPAGVASIGSVHSLELHRWIEQLRSTSSSPLVKCLCRDHEKLIHGKDNVILQEQKWRAVLVCIAHIRHITTHRLQTETETLLNCLGAAGHFLDALQDKNAFQIVNKLHILVEMTRIQLTSDVLALGKFSLRAKDSGTSDEAMADLALAVQDTRDIVCKNLMSQVESLFARPEQFQLSGIIC